MKLYTIMIAGAALAFSLLSSPVGAKVTTEGGDAATAWHTYQQEQTDRLPSMQFPHQACFEKAAKSNQLPLTLLLAVARGESDFNPRARSDANAWGLMQIRWPQTAKHLGIERLTDLLDPCTNVDAGARYLRQLLDRFDQDLHVALAAYNFGPTAIARNLGNIPDKAEWYSGYIYRHLGYVMGDEVAVAETGTETVRHYDQEGKLRLIDFNKPYRAEALVKVIESRHAALRVDWFDRGLGYYQVVLLYQDSKELKQGKRLLKAMGIPAG